MAHMWGGCGRGSKLNHQTQFSVCGGGKEKQEEEGEEDDGVYR